jgi:LysR family hydrogen peroxide-inducible transcriptional activator
METGLQIRRRYEFGHCLRDHALAACKIRDTEKVRRFAASSLLTLVEMVDADLRITFLPEMAEGSLLLRHTNVRLFPLGESSYRSIGRGWRKGSNRVEEFKMLGASLAQQQLLACRSGPWPRSRPRGAPTRDGQTPTSTNQI